MSENVRRKTETDIIIEELYRVLMSRPEPLSIGQAVKILELTKEAVQDINRMAPLGGGVFYDFYQGCRVVIPDRDK